MSLPLYNLAINALVPLFLPWIALHPRLSGGLAQRFGRALPQAVASPMVWFHGASAGDVRALLPLIERFSKKDVGAVISCWTRGGMAIARTCALAPAFHAPLDLRRAARQVLRRYSPRALILECLELWPNTIHACVERGIPVAVVNGRISPRSAQRYRRFSRLFRPTFGSLSLVSALSDVDADRFVAAGVPADRVFVESSSKHASVLMCTPSSLSSSTARRPRLVLGSIHRSEERALFDQFPALYRRVPGLQIVVAPRYPNRAGAVARRLRRMGWSPHLGSSARSDASLLVIDAMGALPQWYRGARVAFVGGSMAPRGGHNVIEPAGQGVFVLVGPHTWNCRQEVDRLLAADGAAIVRNAEQLVAEAVPILQDERSSLARGRVARHAAEQFANAADRLGSRLLALVEP